MPASGKHLGPQENILGLHYAMLFGHVLLYCTLVLYNYVKFKNKIKLKKKKRIGLLNIALTSCKELDTTEHLNSTELN